MALRSAHGTSSAIKFNPKSRAGLKVKQKPPHLNRRDGFRRSLPRVTASDLLGVECAGHMIIFQRLNLGAFDHLLE